MGDEKEGYNSRNFIDLVGLGVGGWGSWGGNGDVYC